MRSAFYFSTIILFALAARPAHSHRVFLDPGHGGKDDGAQGFFAVSEKVLALKLGHALRAALEIKAAKYQLAVEVKLSREDDTFLNLRQRVEMANQWDADLFVSLHANSSPSPKARGFEVYFAAPESTDEAAKRLVSVENDGSEAGPVNSQVLRILSDAQASNHVAKSSRFAEALFQRVSKTLGSNMHGVRQGPFTVLSGTTMPAVLIEVGYVTHVDDALQLTKQTYLWKVADAISSGILEFIRSNKKVS